MLEVKDLHASANGREILKGVDLVVKAGEVHAIMGPNGSGKSTLSFALMGHPKYEVTKGRVLVRGEDVKDREEGPWLVADPHDEGGAPARRRSRGDRRDRLTWPGKHRESGPVAGQVPDLVGGGYFHSVIQPPSGNFLGGLGQCYNRPGHKFGEV